MNMVQQWVEKQDWYDSPGCCLGCTEMDKENMEGLQRDIYYDGKWYSCVCLNCKCKKCSWYFQRECQRKGLDV